MTIHKPKLLIVSPHVYPQPYSGTGMRGHLQAVHWSDAFDVTVLSDRGLYAVDEGRFEVIRDKKVKESGRISAFIRTVLRRTHYTFEKSRCRSWARCDFDSFDAIVIHYPGLLSLLPADLRSRIPVLLDTHNNEREYFETVASQMKNPVKRLAMRK